jgi:hypothetical protein
MELDFAVRATERVPLSSRCGGISQAIRLLNTSEEFGRANAESAGQPNHRREPRVAARAFEQADLGAVQVARLAQGFLREAEPVTVGAEVPGEALSRFHPEDGARAQTRTLQPKTLSPR